MGVDSETQYVSSGGGGYGGWGGFGGFGGIAPVGIIGLNNLFGQHHGHDGHGGSNYRSDIQMLSDNLNSRLESIQTQLNTNQVEAQINRLDDHLDNTNTRLEAFKDTTQNAFSDVRREIALTGKDIVIAEKDLLHAIDKCCCETNRNIDDKFSTLLHAQDKGFSAVMQNGDRNTQTILDRLCAMETAQLRDEINELRSFRNSVNIRDSVISGVRANTVGSSFNTGTQSNQNNSGQITG